MTKGIAHNKLLTKTRFTPAIIVVVQPKPIFCTPKPPSVGPMKALKIEKSV